MMHTETSGFTIVYTPKLHQTLYVGTTDVTNHQKLNTVLYDEQLDG